MSDTTEKGILTFFFGKKKHIKNIKSPLSYRKLSNKSSDKTMTTKKTSTFCEFQDIFDEHTHKCVSRSSEIGQKLSMKRFKTHINDSILCSEFSGLWQFKDNCWFNSLLMCLFYSDKTRKIMNSVRQDWISNSYDNKKKELLYIFNYLMELPFLNDNIEMNTIDSNMILEMLHRYDRRMFEHPGYEGGSGILYCKRLLHFLGITEYVEVRIIELSKEREVYIEINHKPVERIKLQDITYRDIWLHIIYLLKRKCKTKPRLMAIYIDFKSPFPIPNTCWGMTIASMYISNYKNTKNSDRHAVAGITCNNQMYIYDGQRALLKKALKPFNWKQYMKSFSMTYNVNNIMRYDFSKSNRIAFFVG
jgi:hypothetical protein